MTSPIRGKFVRLSISKGMRPRQGERSISAACADRDRLATQSNTSFSYCRTYTNTERFAGRMKLSEPLPKILLDLRTDIRRLVQLSREARLRDCASTFTAW
jgi:hypothetical protein